MSYLDKCEEHAPKTLIDIRGKTVKEITALVIRSSFERHNGHHGRMQAELGIAKSTLYRWMAKLALYTPRVGPGRPRKSEASLPAARPAIHPSNAELIEFLWGKKNNG